MARFTRRHLLQAGSASIIAGLSPDAAQAQDADEECNNSKIKPRKWDKGLTKKILKVGRDEYLFKKGSLRIIQKGKVRKDSLVYLPTGVQPQVPTVSAGSSFYLTIQIEPVTQGETGSVDVDLFFVNEDDDYVNIVGHGQVSVPKSTGASTVACTVPMDTAPAELLIRVSRADSGEYAEVVNTITIM